MTKDAIIAAIKKLTPEERQEILEVLREPTEEDYELTPEDIAVADARWQEMEEHPERSMTVDELKRKLNALTKQHELRA